MKKSCASILDIIYTWQFVTCIVVNQTKQKKVALNCCEQFQTFL